MNVHLFRLFIIEGLVTVVIACVAFFILPGKYIRIIHVSKFKTYLPLPYRLPNHNKVALGTGKSTSCCTVDHQ